ncbi:3-ketoacyl-CoA thiolase 2, peroxisomal-like isoform X2 [Miscanthus floridulus]|uniref:3-ketoacyl-CoA thiolase 2, peroxisomal-like isoform X2 n=1 Tax=Miscanthus floridulus TaxID=154761 RepID=UPI0034598AB5
MMVGCLNKKKLDLRGVMTTPGFPFKKKIFSHRSRKPPNPRPHPDAGGNSSQVSDAAGAVLVMKSSVAQKKGLPILSVFRSFIAVGVGPAVMGVGPAVAIPAAVKSAGLEIGDIDMFELNVAFASQFVYCCNKLGLDRSKVNVNGDTIALGHPLVATGSRCVALRSVKLNSYSKTSLKSTQ